MIISMIAAHDPHLVIGKDGSLPWNIPEDLKHFKARTMGHPILMGRGVFDELNRKPLPGRMNLVLSRSISHPDVSVFSTAEDAMEFLRSKNIEKVYIIGGEQIYKLFYPHCNRLEITEIHTSYKGDTFFPEYRTDIGTRWKEIGREEKDNLTFIDYEEIRPSV
ncbi:dihydrofolate reductase [Balneolaceae bacterium ANBcel3]|nr:dihydrofolate reductase [Balneolaceae bacterium ANBcel3]